MSRKRKLKIANWVVFLSIFVALIYFDLAKYLFLMLPLGFLSRKIDQKIDQINDDHETEVDLNNDSTSR